MKERLLR